MGLGAIYGVYHLSLFSFSLYTPCLMLKDDYWTSLTTFLSFVFLSMQCMLRKKYVEPLQNNQTMHIINENQ